MIDIRQDYLLAKNGKSGNSIGLAKAYETTVSEWHRISMQIEHKLWTVQLPYEAIYLFHVGFNR